MPRQKIKGIVHGKLWNAYRGLQPFFLVVVHVKKEVNAIRVRTAARNFVYKVESIQVTEPDWQGAVEQTPDPTVTLITCFPFEYIGSAPRRFIVRATLDR